jgi:hypothetical protein
LSAAEQLSGGLPCHYDNGENAQDSTDGYADAKNGSHYHASGSMFSVKQEMSDDECDCSNNHAEASKQYQLLLL